MFESVVPETFTKRSRRLLYETLPLSLALHALAAGMALASALWTVGFPSQSPRVVRAYSLARLPDPPPPPPPPAPKNAAPRAAAKPAPPPPPPPLQLAPTKIPDLIPQIAEVDPPPAAPPPPEAQPAPSGPSQSSDAPKPQGEPGGEIGGKLHGVKGGIFFADDGRLHVEKNVKLPMATVEQEFPAYPDAARKERLEGVVLLRYVIGEDGRVKDVEIVSPSKHQMFDDAARDSVRRWRFRPFVKDGKRIEVVHEVEFNFEFVQR